MTQVTARMRLEPRGFVECLLEWAEHFSDMNGQEL